MAVDLRKLEEEVLELERRRGLEDLYYFNKHILGYKDMEPKPHKRVCDYIEAKSRSTRQLKKLLMLPRGTFKTSVVTIGSSIQELAKDPNKRILIDNEVYGNSKAMLRELKGHLQSPRVLDLYPKLEPNKQINDGWTESSVIIKGRTRSFKEPSISCAGLDQIKVSMHYDIIIMDDLVSTRNVTTKEQIDKVIEHYKMALSLLEPDGELIIVGTRYHYSDLYGYILENEADIFKTLILPAILENGELLFPERLSREFLEEQRSSQGPYIYNCQYMLDPVDEESAELKKDWIRYFDGEVEWVKGQAYLEISKIYDQNKTPLMECRQQRVPIEIYITMDPASKKKKKSDWTTLWVNGITPDNRWFTLDMIRDKLNPRERVDSVFELVRRWSPKLTGIEEVGFQDTISFYAKEKMREEDFFFRIRALSTGGQKKEDRILKLQPRFEHNMIFLPRRLIRKCYDGRSYDLVQEFLSEYIFFPLAKHDDLLDALAYQADVIPNKRKEKKARRKGRSTFIGG